MASELYMNFLWAFEKIGKDLNKDEEYFKKIYSYVPKEELEDYKHQFLAEDIDDSILDETNEFDKDEIDENLDNSEDNMKFKLVEAAESKICCICKKPFDGYGNNAEPVCSGSCCDECNMNEVIPARLKMLDNSSSEDLDEAVLNETDESGNDEMDANCADCGAVITIPVDHDGPAYCANCMKNHLNEALEDYTITYYLSTATRERRPETRADIDHDFKIVSVDDIDNDFDAMKYAFMLHNNLDESDVDYEVADQDIKSVEDFIEYFDERDWGDGSIIILKVEGPRGVVYDTGHDKQSFIDVYNENEKYDREMLDRISAEDPDTAEQFRKVLGYTESLQESYEAEAVDLASRIIDAIDASGWSNRFVYNEKADIAIELPDTTVKTYSVSIDDEGMMTLSNERGPVLASAEVDSFIEDAVVEILGYTTEALEDGHNEVTAEVVCDDCDDDYTFEALNESISNDIVTKRFNHLYGVE